MDAGLIGLRWTENSAGRQNMTTSVCASFETTLQKLGVGAAWERRGGSWWIAPGSPNVRAITQIMVANDARLVTVSSAENPEGEILLDYHWDLNGELITIEITTKNKQIDTITDISPAADWVEREIHDYFKVEFLGRIDTKRLMTREGDPQGMFCKGGTQ
jgi:hypothetical protein